MSSAKEYCYPRANATLLANLPHELTKYKCWVVWHEAPNGSNPKFKKLPQNPLTLNGDNWNDPANWSSRATACEVFLENPTLRGVGFVFHKCSRGKCFNEGVLLHAKDQEHPFAFFDLDNVIVKGKLLPWAQEFVNMANSYTEISPSGTGIKIIIRAKVGDRKKTFEFKDSEGNPHELEVYDCNRFFAATGNRIEGTPTDIADRQELLDTLHPEGEEEEPAGAAPDRALDAFAQDVDAIADDTLLEKILASKQGKKFKRLMAGDKAGYAGNFAAASALCTILAFWTRANPERIDKLFRKSKLFVEWWWEDECYKDDTSRRDYVISRACKKAASKQMFTPPTSGLITTEDGRIKPLMANAITMLKTTPCWKGVLGFNELTMLPVKLAPAPWENQQTGTTPWTDHDDTKLAEWFERHGLFIDSSKRSGEAAQAVARERSFHPVRDYLESQKWDSTKRLDTWLPTYLGTPNNEFTLAAGRCWLLAAVARIYRPGCKVDHVLTLEGEQGRLKSTALNVLAGDEFFLDDFSGFDNKDERLKMHGAWIIELAELKSIRHAEVDKVKSFLTSKDDVFRAPYDRRPQHHLRMCIFAASTNASTPFTDESGNRRFWPVRCKKIEIEKLREHRDQLWAEAVARFKDGEKWWFDSPELDKLAAEEQRERYQPGQWDAAIEKWLEEPTQRTYWETDKEGKPTKKRYVTPWDSDREEVTVDDILLHVIEKPLDRRTHPDVLSVVKYLKHNHWERVSIREGNRVRRVYRRPPDVTVAPEL
jgi:predicted P-loop ATPase